MVRINGKDVAVHENASLNFVLSENGYNLATIVVELNGEVVSQDDFEATIVKQSDTLEVLNFVGGG
ncbi:MAG: sulfur carrier protein ThiS [Candidatus Ancillula sp.]|nr:sulfur carrier protein ThiS [Candidatus Ancillula sp.]